MRVYLAGPDVFLPNPIARGAALKAICLRHGLIGMFPLDELENEPRNWATLPEARRIALRNEAHIGRCDALIANLTPFRGPSSDVGTVFELGYMRALARPVFGWSNSADRFHARTRAYVRATCGPDGVWRDSAGLALEDFGLHDNLMIDGAIAASGGALVAGDVPQERRWDDLSIFERCVIAAAEVLLSR
jgi:nucleoside 2-deoxyribosyltransferase